MPEMSQEIIVFEGAVCVCVWKGLITKITNISLFSHLKHFSSSILLILVTLKTSLTTWSHLKPRP